MGAAAAAASRSASANTTLADLPPSSSVTRLIVSAARARDPAAYLGRAGERDLGHVGVLHQALAAHAAGAGHHVQHALGQPASEAIFSSSSAVSGVSSAGLSTTVLPAASAGPSFHAAIDEREVPGHDQPHHAERLAEGHVHAPGHRDRVAEQPLGRSRRSSGRSPPPCPSRPGRRRSACPRCGPPARPGPRARCSTASARARIVAERAPGSSARHAGKAARARSTAASTSSAPARGTSAITAAVAGSTTEITRRPPGRARPPPAP